MLSEYVVQEFNTFNSYISNPRGTHIKQRQSRGIKAWTIRTPAKKDDSHTMSNNTNSRQNENDSHCNFFRMD